MRFTTHRAAILAGVALLVTTGIVARGTPQDQGSGFPDLVVPAGYTSDRLPVGISFFGPAFTEARLLGLGYAFEQATQIRRDPSTTPDLPGDVISR